MSEPTLGLLHPGAMGSTVGEAAREMTLQRVSSLLVRGEENAGGIRRVPGILTDRDALKIFFEPGATRVDDVMSDAPVTVSVHAPLVDVLDRMMAADLDQVLVYEEAGGARAHGKLVGVVTRARLLPPLLASLRDDVRRRQAPRDGAP